MKLVQGIACVLLLACSRGSYEHEEPDTPSGGGAVTNVEPLPENQPFQLRAEFEGACERQSTVDVNLGNAPEAFVRAAHCQITGEEPAAEAVAHWAEQLRTMPYVRRVDVVRSLCLDVGRQCSLAYTDPWQAQVSLTEPCARKGTRDVGAVFMFWGDCPGGVNCGMDWANTHASGMDARHTLYGFEEGTQGYYNPVNPGFWRRELLDARWAGLQFLLPNVYGPDMVHLAGIGEVLDAIGGGIGIGLFDDTWGWGRSDREPFNQVPSLNDTEATAALIYENKWKVFFSTVPSEHWYRVADRPFIYFYNAGTLRPLDRSAGVIERMKQLFAADFGVEPFVVADRAFFADPRTAEVADGEFVWNTFSRNEMSLHTIKGVTLAHFMSKWDAIGRDTPGRVAGSGDRVIKGPELLSEYITASESANVAVLATWNDLGEGTGIARNYDYYHQGQWLEPNAFLRVIRSSQCSN